jgi:hypothetical protein
MAVSEMTDEGYSWKLGLEGKVAACNGEAQHAA